MITRLRNQESSLVDFSKQVPTYSNSQSLNQYIDAFHSKLKNGWTDLIGYHLNTSIIITAGSIASLLSYRKRYIKEQTPYATISYISL